MTYMKIQFTKGLGGFGYMVIQNDECSGLIDEIGNSIDPELAIEYFIIDKDSKGPE